MYQFLVSFTVQPEHRDHFVRAYAEGPTWLMRGNLIGDSAT